jgi:radical SAM superfamily enzyme YgiQ (UPF0313 family)
MEQTMKILFANPPWWLGKGHAGVRAGSRWPFSAPVRSTPDNFIWGDYLPYPFFLGYAASYVRAKRPDVQVLFRDSIALRESYDSFGDYLAEECPDFLVIESATPSWQHDKQILEVIKGFRSVPRIILVGPVASSADILHLHCSCNPGGILHASIKGEYEKGILKVLDGAMGELDHDLLTVEEMNAAPPPWLDDMHWWRYVDTNPEGQKFPHLQAWTSRGCWARCAFCVWPATMTGNDPDGQGKRVVRHYSADYMLEYLGEAVNRYPFKSIYFDDDLFNTSDAHVLAMCEVMQKVNRKIDIPWSCMCRADHTKRETWKAMRDSGCFGVKLGFESGSQRVVNDIIGKQLDLKEATETVKYLVSLGMSIHGTFTFGHPGETPAEMQETVNYIHKLQSLGMDTYQTSGVAPIEGTPLDTLLQVGPLKRYPGAVKDENFDPETDGARKMQAIAERFGR